MYIVEFCHNGDGLAEPMARIRIWLDHQQIETDAAVSRRLLELATEFEEKAAAVAARERDG